MAGQQATLWMGMMGEREQARGLVGVEVCQRRSRRMMQASPCSPYRQPDPRGQPHRVAAPPSTQVPHTLVPDLLPAGTTLPSGCRKRMRLRLLRCMEEGVG